MGMGLEWSSTCLLQHLLKLSIGALVFWSPSQYIDFANCFSFWGHKCKDSQESEHGCFGSEGHLIFVSNCQFIDYTYRSSDFMTPTGLYEGE